MAKKIYKQLRLQIKGGAANPSPPIGPALGAAGVNIMNFCKQFNAESKEKEGKLLPVSVTVYEDKSFEFDIHNTAVPVQLLEVCSLKKASKEPNRTKVAKITWDQIKAIAESKMEDMNCFVLESAMSMVAGTARSMGIEVIEENPSQS